MAIGPVQLLVLGFQQPDFTGEIREELDRAVRSMTPPGPPERPGSTTHTSRTPWRRGWWARP